MTRPVEEIWPGLFYAYGVASTTVAGDRHLQHRGGALGISSAFTADMDEGVGAVVLCSGPGGEAMGLAHAILHLLRYAPRPGVSPLPSAVVSAGTPDAAAYSGTYRSRSTTFTISNRDETLLFTNDTRSVILTPRGPDAYFADHPNFSRFLLRFGRENGVVVEAFHGADWYTNDRYTGQAASTIQPRGRPIPGTTGRITPSCPTFESSNGKAGSSSATRIRSTPRSRSFRWTTVHLGSARAASGAYSRSMRLLAARRCGSWSTTMPTTSSSRTNSSRSALGDLAWAVACEGCERRQ